MDMLKLLRAIYNMEVQTRTVLISILSDDGF